LATFALRARADTKQLDEWANIIFQLVGKDFMEQTNYVRQRAQVKKMST
jgi:hypothetical protein